MLVSCFVSIVFPNVTINSGNSFLCLYRLSIHHFYVQRYIIFINFYHTDFFIISSWWSAKTVLSLCNEIYLSLVLIKKHINLKMIHWEFKKVVQVSIYSLNTLWTLLRLYYDLTRFILRKEFVQLKFFCSKSQSSCKFVFHTRFFFTSNFGILQYLYLLNCKLQCLVYEQNR